MTISDKLNIQHVRSTQTSTHFGRLLSLTMLLITGTSRVIEMSKSCALLRMQILCWFDAKWNSSFNVRKSSAWNDIQVIEFDFATIIINAWICKKNQIFVSGIKIIFSSLEFISKSNSQTQFAQFRTHQQNVGQRIITTRNNTENAKKIQLHTIEPNGTQHIAYEIATKWAEKNSFSSQQKNSNNDAFAPIKENRVEYASHRREL